LDIPSDSTVGHVWSTSCKPNVTAPRAANPTPLLRGRVVVSDGRGLHQVPPPVADCCCAAADVLHADPATGSPTMPALTLTTGTLLRVTGVGDRRLGCRDSRLRKRMITDSRQAQGSPRLMRSADGRRLKAQDSPRLLKVTGADGCRPLFKALPDWTGCGMLAGGATCAI